MENQSTNESEVTGLEQSSGLDISNQGGDVSGAEPVADASQEAVNTGEGQEGAEKASDFSQFDDAWAQRALTNVLLEGSPAPQAATLETKQQVETPKGELAQATKSDEFDEVLKLVADLDETDPERIKTERIVALMRSNKESLLKQEQRLEARIKQEEERLAEKARINQEEERQQAIKLVHSLTDVVRGFGYDSVLGKPGTQLDQAGFAKATKVLKCAQQLFKQMEQEHKGANVQQMEQHCLRMAAKTLLGAPSAKVAANQNGRFAGARRQAGGSGGGGDRPDIRSKVAAILANA